jgi:hypothetical protein
MLSFFVLLLLLIITVVIFLVLRKNQQQHARETADRTAPLPALDDTLPDFAPPPFASASTPPNSADNWLQQVRTLRTSQQYDEALEVCLSQFPKAQAIQQAAIILRQQIKVSQENNIAFEDLLQNLYNLAAMADVYGGTRHAAAPVAQIMAALYNCKGNYRAMGYQKLKLLNKNDIRLLEEAWGKPTTHRRAEEIYAF